MALEGIVVACGQASSILGLFIGLRVITTMMDPATFGIFALGLTVSVFGNQVIYGPIANGVVRYFAIAAEQNASDAYLQASRKLLKEAFAKCLGLGMLAAAVLLALGFNAWSSIVFAGACLAATSGASATFSMMLNAARHRKLVALHQCIEPWVKLGLAVTCMRLLEHDAVAALAGYALTHTLSFLVLQGLLRAKTADATADSSSPKNVWRAQIQTFAKPFVYFAAFTWLNIASDKWALQIFSTSQEVGLYAVAFMLGYSPMATFSSLLVQFAAPLLYMKAGGVQRGQGIAGARALAATMLAAIAVFTLVAALVALLFHERIFRIAVAPEYLPASPMMLWAVLAGGLFSAGEAGAIYLNTLLKSQAQIVPKIATAVLGMVLNVMGAYLYGAQGVILAVLVFSFLYCFWINKIAWNPMATVDITRTD